MKIKLYFGMVLPRSTWGYTRNTCWKTVFVSQDRHAVNDKLKSYIEDYHIEIKYRTFDTEDLSQIKYL